MKRLGEYTKLTGSGGGWKSRSKGVSSPVALKNGLEALKLELAGAIQPCRAVHRRRLCPLLGVKRTCRLRCEMSA